MHKPRIPTGLAVVAAFLLTAAGAWGGPAPPSNLVAVDHPWDNGSRLDLSWELSPDDATIESYKVLRSLSTAEVEDERAEALRSAVKAAKAEATERLIAEAGLETYALEELPSELRGRIREARREAAEQAESSLVPADGMRFVGFVKPGVNRLTVEKLVRGQPYSFEVLAVGKDGSLSAPARSAAPVEPARQLYDGARFYLSFIVALLCGSVIWYILRARSGEKLRIRKIAGLEAVQEAVGRATEMGRPILFVTGIQDMNDIQTIAGLTVLSRVAKTAAEYDATIEVPTSRSLVMTAARETVQAAYLAAGRPDAYNEDNIYYVTDEQFGFVAYASGHMVRTKPAACFYMGAFFAESLILAETGNAVGAIQVAGTAMPAQLPFFVAACDYTLIGEEFFAASAYLSGEPDQLGSLKGQDVGKLVVGVGMVVGITLATLGVLFGSDKLLGWVDYLKHVMLT